MTALDHLTAAFETLWETKIHLLRTSDGAPTALQPELQAVLAEVAASRDRVEKLLIALQAQPSSAPPSPQG